MKIKNLIKPAAVLCVASVLLSASGCSDTSWSFKTEKTTLSNGNWIFNTYIKYDEGLSKISEENSDSSVSETSIDINSSKIEDKDAVDWIYEEAKDACLAQLTVEKLIADNKVKIDETQIEWVESMYKSYYFGMSSALEEMGVSQETFMNVYARYPQLREQLFTALYSKGGSKEVSDDELKKYFTENYTDYFYLSYSLKTTDEDGNTVDIDDETKDKVKTNFAKYADMLTKDGKTVSDVEEQYKTDFEAESAPSSSSVANLENSGISDDLKKAIEELKDKNAAVKTIDDTTYLIYKGSISEDAEKITDDETDPEEDTNIPARSDILRAMKSDDYDKYLEEEQKKLDYDSNDACLSKYSVQRTIDIVKKIQEQT